MKKTRLICLLLCLSFLLCGCDPTWWSCGEVLQEEVAKVELIYYYCAEATVHAYTGFGDEKVLPFDSQKAEVLETLSQDKQEEFLVDLAICRLWAGAEYADSPSGFSLRLTYSDGSFAVISVLGTLICHYAANGEVLRVIGAPIDLAKYYELIREHFETKI